MSKSTALYIRCTKEVQDLIREEARKDHRSISSYVLHVVLTHLETRNAINEKIAVRKAYLAADKRRLTA